MKQQDSQSASMNSQLRSTHPGSAPCLTQPGPKVTTTVRQGARGAAEYGAANRTAHSRTTGVGNSIPAKGRDQNNRSHFTLIPGVRLGPRSASRQLGAMSIKATTILAGVLLITSAITLREYLSPMLPKASAISAKPVVTYTKGGAYGWEFLVKKQGKAPRVLFRMPSDQPIKDPDTGIFYCPIAQVNAKGKERSLALSDIARLVCANSIEATQAKEVRKWMRVMDWHAYCEGTGYWWFRDLASMKWERIALNPPPVNESKARKAYRYITKGWQGWKDEFRAKREQRVMRALDYGFSLDGANGYEVEAGPEWYYERREKWWRKGWSPHEKLGCEGLFVR
jgi:hypothetical protein